MCDWKEARAALEPCKSRRPTLEDMLTVKSEYVTASEGCSTNAEACRELAVEKVALYLWVERPSSALAQPDFRWGLSSTLLAHFEYPTCCHVRQVRVHEWLERDSISLLPKLREQRCCKVFAVGTGADSSCR